MTHFSPKDEMRRSQSSLQLFGGVAFLLVLGGLGGSSVSSSTMLRTESVVLDRIGPDNMLVSMKDVIGMGVGMSPATGDNTTKVIQEAEREEEQNDDRVFEPLPPVDSWPNRPIFLQADESTVVPGPEGASKAPCPVGTPFEFETDLFKGKALIRFRDLETSNNPDDDKSYFHEGRKRLSQVIVQGQFKKPISVADVVTGREFERPLQLVPPPFVSRVLQRVLRRLSPSVEMDLSSSTPKVTANFAGSIQAIRADLPGQEPDIATAQEIQENNAIMFGNDNEDNEGVSPKQRKRIFSNPRTASDFVFDTSTVYTFNNFDDSFDYIKYAIDLKVLRFDLTRTLDQQPFQFMAKSKAHGKPLWMFHIWNERLLSTSSPW